MKTAPKHMNQNVDDVVHTTYTRTYIPVRLQQLANARQESENQEE